MEVKRIVVDELPKNCASCFYCGTDYSERPVCFALEKEKDIGYVVLGYRYPEIRPSWCPLQVEDECVYTGEYGGYDEYGDVIFFSKKTTCSDSHFQKVSIPNNTFCPNCGKRIRYEEE